MKDDFLNETLWLQIYSNRLVYKRGKKDIFRVYYDRIVEMRQYGSKYVNMQTPTGRAILF